MKNGPSDRIRTCGILLPKQARYQLRYTRLYIVGLSGRPIVYPTARPFSRAFCTGGRKKL